MKTGFIGLGALGKTIARRLISEGVELAVWNRTASKAAGLKAEIAESPAKLACEVETVFVCLFDSDGVASILQQMGKTVRGRLVIDLTTNHFEPVVGFHKLVQELGGSYLEAPVLGSVVPASKGALTVVTSGDRSAYDRALPLLQKIAANIFHLETPGHATRMKLINNLCLGVFMAAVAEAAAVGESAGIERRKVLEILAAGAGNSGVLNAKKEKLLSEDFSVHFSNALIHKDLHFLQDLCRRLNRPLFMGSAAKELFGMAMAKGMEKEDFSSVYKVLKNI